MVLLKITVYKFNLLRPVSWLLLAVEKDILKLKQ